MCDFEDDFNEFDADEHGNEDHFEDEWQTDADTLDDDLMDEPPADHTDFDEFNVSDAAFIGGTIFGNAYEEGVDERRRRKLMKRRNKDSKFP